MSRTRPARAFGPRPVRRPRSQPRPTRMKAADVLRVGGAGLRTRPTRVLLSALGIALGVAALIAVVGVSASGRENLDRRLDALGTNLLTAAPGKTATGAAAGLPPDAVAMVARIGPVEAVSAIGKTGAKVYRNDRIPPQESGGIGVYAARLDLPATVGTSLAHGTWLNPANEGYPAVVLGPVAAARLGVRAPGPDVQVWLGRRWFTVIGILAPAPLAAELDTAALVGWPEARRDLDFDGNPTTVYTRADNASIADVAAVLGATANPANPNEVEVSRPSDALAAREAADDALNGLLVGLGSVALLVGGVGVANTMVISVLERRAEIGLRRALGATRGHIGTQFLSEALLLSVLGGAGGILLGSAATVGYSTYRHWPAVVPPWAMAGGLVATLVVGVCAGLYPALRAAHLAPTEALAAA
ncbi:ABC transporter permease [Embleya hyalina]|uniref:ABC transporter permease n=2 Tax=Embleya hyalina TaxID=516124 RepID=A0A401Z6L8_9ACTN|nr:ABC transporter permease [Embleya hyalina]